MWTIHHPPDLAADRALLKDPEGDDQLVVLAKATYSWAAGPLQRTPRPRPLQIGPSFRGDPHRTPLRSDTDLTLRKPATDVVVHAVAHADPPRPWVDATLAVADRVSTLRIWGDRHWRWHPDRRAFVATDPIPFARMPLGWDHAYGGISECYGPHPTNPWGRGFARTPLEARGLRLPNVEHPDHPVQQWTDTPPPAGWGPVPLTIEPRRSRAGTYDAAWRETRAPFLPEDWDPRSLQCAPDPLQFRPHLRGGERLLLRGVDPGGDVSFALPGPAPKAVLHGEGGEEPVELVLHTVLVNAPSRWLSLTWQAQRPLCWPRDDIRTITLSWS